MRALKFLCIGLLAWSAAVQAEELIIIANTNAPVASLSQDELASIYLLKTTVWRGGGNIVPVNREAASSARTLFSDTVLRQPSNALAAYWNQMHFKGKAPPLVQESDQAVLAFVQNVPGAIGYINAAAPHQNVKVLTRVP